MMNTRLTGALIAAVVATFPINAFAQDWGRVLSDPNYLPLTGELDGTTAYTYGSMKGDTRDSLGAPLSSFKLQTNTIEQSFDYGINDDFALNLSWAYDPSVHRSVDPVMGPSSSRDKSGFDDPSIGATYRILDERQGPMILDVFGSYSPDFFKAELATPTDDGTIARGGQAATAGLALGREWQNFGIRATAEANWLGARSVDDPVSVSTFHEGSVWNYALGLTAQARFDDRMSLNFGGGYNFRDNYPVSNPALASSFTAQPGDVGNLHAALNYHFIPNRFVGSLTYQYNSYGSSKNTNGIPSTLDTEIHNQSENIFGARLNYVLN